jgi:hypothetical protein
MDILNMLNEKNPHKRILSLNDKQFKSYGRIHNTKGLSPVLHFLKENAVAKERQVYYEPSILGLQLEGEFFSDIRNTVYGEMDIQAGWCYGWNTKLNGLEYHKGSEVIVAATDLILLLGRKEDIRFEERPVYNSNMTEAFYVEEGTAVELYANTLHYAPIQVNTEQQFTAAIILPVRTNYPLKYVHQSSEEDVILAAINKWLIIHPDTGKEHIGITGENIEILAI